MYALAIQEKLAAKCHLKQEPHTIAAMLTNNCLSLKFMLSLICRNESL